MIHTRISNMENDLWVNLEFPASDISIQDAYSLLGTTNPSNLNIEYIKATIECTGIAYNHVPLEELNCLVSLVDQMTPDQVRKMKACVKLLGVEGILGEINAACNEGNCEMQTGIRSHRDLGKLVLANYMDEDLAELPEHVYGLLDAEKVGRDWISKEGGVLMEDGYCFQESDFTTPFLDGKLPFDPPEYAVQIQKAGIRISLPAEESEIESFIGVTGSDGCVDVFFNPSNGSSKRVGMDKIGELNRFVQEYMDIPDARTRQKFIAVLVTSDGDDVQKIRQNLDQYDYAASPEEYGREYFKKNVPQEKQVEFADCIDFHRYGCEAMVREGATLTRHGIIRQEGMPLEQAGDFTQGL